MSADRAGALAEQARRFYDTGNFAQAELACRQVLQVNPQHAETLHLLGLIAYAAHRYDDAVALMQRALSRGRGKAHHYSNLGLALHAQGNYQKARQAFRRAVTSNPAEPRFHLNLGNTLKDAGDIEAALISFNRAIALDASLAGAHVGRALCLLTTGRISEAWPDYEWRTEYWRDVGLDPATAGDAYKLPQQPSRLSRIDLAGKRILLLKEQGLGDELFFLRYVARLKRAGAWIAYLGSRELQPLLANCASIDMLIDESSSVPPHDLALAMGDLPLVTARIDDAVPEPLPLTVPRHAKERAIARLAAAGPAPYLAVTWRAGIDAIPGRPMTLRKSIPVERLAAALSVWPGTAVIVQRAPTSQEIAVFAKASGLRIGDLSDCNEDLALMAAVLELVSEYVGVSNTNMHVRAGLQMPARVLIPFPPEWRWTLKHERSPWFPALTLYREDQTRGWDAAMSALSRDVAA